MGFLAAVSSVVREWSGLERTKTWPVGLERRDLEPQRPESERLVWINPLKCAK